MKLVLATPIFPPESGGPGTYTSTIAEKLYPHYESVVVTYSDNALSLPHTRVVAIRKSQPLVFRWCAYTWTLLRELRTADLVYAQNAVAAGFPAVIAGMVLRKPVIIKMVGDEAWERARQDGSTHDELASFLQHPDGSLRTRVLMLIQGFTLRRATLVTTPAHYLLRVITETYALSPEKTAVNVNASDVLTPSPSPQIPHSIAVVARLTAWKGIGGVIRALTTVRETFPNASLRIAGDGPERVSLEVLVRKLSLENNVQFLGTISKDAVNSLLSSAHVFVLNSNYEGMPHVVLESFASSTPVIATDIDGTKEIITNEKNGMLVPVGDDSTLASVIVRLFSDNALRDALIREGSHSLVHEFSWERHLETLKGFFTRVSKE